MNTPILFFILSLIVKLALGIAIPLASDEAYYWIWAKNLQLSYFDHPPMVSWLFFLGKPFDYLLSAPRIPGILIGHTTLFIWYKMVAPYIDTNKQKWLLWALLLTPLTGLGSLVITPDLPLLFFWTLAIYQFLRLIKTQTNLNALLLGSVLGLGFCSKYNVVLFFPIALFVLFSRRRETSFSTKHYLLVTLAFLVFSSPVIYWNIQNNFASFRFQLNHGLGQRGFTLYWLLKFVFDQLMLILPPIIFLALRPPKIRELGWLFAFGWGPIIFFTLTSLKGRAEANWALVSIPPLISLAVINSESHLRLIKGAVATWAAVLVLILGLLIFPIEKVSNSISKIRETRELKSLLVLAEDYTPLYTSTYQMASLLSYYSRKEIYKLQGVGRRDFFDFLEASLPTAKKFFWLAPSPSYLPSWAKTYRVQLVIPTPVAKDTYLYEVISP